MRGLGRPIVDVAKWALFGYLLTFVVLVSGVVVLSAIALAASVSRLTLGIGPVPLMSFWNSGEDYGFQSEWGVGLVSCFGAAVGGVMAVRRQRASRTAP
ncbi:MAG TPA: hypothetical protein VIK06_10320 [Candidatus Limnocylindrales bacterium]